MGDPPVCSDLKTERKERKTSDIKPVQLLVDIIFHLLKSWCRVFAFQMLTKQYSVFYYLKSENRKCI